MARIRNGGELFKKTAAVILSMVMVFGAVSALPDMGVKDGVLVASAEEKDRSSLYKYETDDCIFYFDLDNRVSTITAILEDIEILNDDGVVEIPSMMKRGRFEYELTKIGKHVLSLDTKVKSVTVPDTVTYIDEYFLTRSSVESLTLPDTLEYAGFYLAAYCSSLKTLNYTGTKVTPENLSSVLAGSAGLKNEKGAVCFGNWVLSYSPNDDPSYLKVSELSDSGVKIDHIAKEAFNYNNSVTFLDLEGVVYIGDKNFNKFYNLETIVNDDDLESAGDTTFTDIPWYDNAKKSGLVRIGKMLRYYRTDEKVIDLTSGRLEGINDVKEGALVDCREADTLVCNSDCKLAKKCFYPVYSYNLSFPKDIMPVQSTYKIKNIFLDGKKLEFSKDDPKMPEWVSKNCEALTGTEWRKINVTEKTKALLEQLDLTYYGTDNDKIGTLSPTEEFYAILKVHDYISTYDYDYDFHCFLDGFQALNITNCAGYAQLHVYLLECAGVQGLYISSIPKGEHAWNQFRIGDEWFEADGGWDAQIDHDYGWFALSSEKVAALDAASTQRRYSHSFNYYIASWYYQYIKKSGKRIIAERTLGDVNGDHTRDQEDVDMLWTYLKSESRNINEKTADVNFDGVIDITDGVLLENMVNGKAVDPDDFPVDGLAPGFKVVFVNTNDYDYENYEYVFTDRDGYIVLPEPEYEVPEGKKFGGWDYGREGKVGKAGEKVKIKNPYTVIQPIWKNESDPDEEWLPGDVDGSDTIDIGDVSMIINHINGVKALDEEALLRADVNKSGSVDISDASMIVNHINGIKALEGMV